MNQVLVRTLSWFEVGQLLLVCSRGLLLGVCVQRERALLSPTWTLLQSQGPIPMASFNFNYFFRDSSPNTVTQGVMASTSGLGRDTNVQSLTVIK